LTDFYLVACVLLLTQGAAMGSGSESIDDLLAMNLNNQTTLNQIALNQTTINSSDFISSDSNLSDFDSSRIVSSFFNSLDLNSTERSSSDLGSSEYEFSDFDFADNYTQTQSEPEVISLAFPAADLNGDNATDLLVTNISSDAGIGGFDSEISALSGSNGSILWQKEYPGSLVFAQTAGDLNGDGQTDVMINEILAAGSFIPYSSVSAFCGRNGTVIWSRSHMLAMTFAYPVQDNSGKNASEFLVHVFGMDSMNNGIFTSIARVNGSNGTNLDERMFSGALAIEYPAGNLTDDLATDSIAAIYQLNGSIASDGVGKDVPLNITDTIFEARDGQEHKPLWNRSFAGPALAMPVTDLTGDGSDEILVYLIKYAENGSISSDLIILQGSDGELLWQQSFFGMVFAMAGPDLTGEGLRDLIVYNLGESENAEVLAVKGDDGRLLWSKEGMIFIPP
jgi:hypothetical protein